MEIREVKIEEYWPQIVKGTAEFGQIAVALNPEFNKLAKCIYEVLNESFVATASEFGVSRWEHILGITPATGATLDDRKAAVLTYLNIQTPYTWRVLKQMLVPILGGEDKFVMEYVNDEGKLVLHTDRLDDDMLDTVSDLLERVLPQNIEVVQYNHHIEVSWRDINKYAECVTVEDMLAVNPDYKNDLTSEGEWVYPLSELQSEQTLFANSPMRKFSSSFPKVKTFYNTFELSDLSGEVIINAESATSANRLLNQTNITKATLNLPNATDINRVCNYCFQLEELRGNLNKAIGGEAAFYRCEKLRVFEVELPSLSNGKYWFNSAQLNKDSALRILNSIPSYTSGDHPLVIGIHADHKTDEDVLDAIANAKAKGWTLTVQWNGTPTSGISTMDLEEIWCKVTESEHGDYTDENGNRCMLDWGHYVTDTTEYKLFFSLVEAEQYFKLTKVTENE